MSASLSSVESLIARAEGLLARLEAVLPHPATAPDWGASVAFRYRRRGSVGGSRQRGRQVGGTCVRDAARREVRLQ